MKKIIAAVLIAFIVSAPFFSENAFFSVFADVSPEETSADTVTEAETEEITSESEESVTDETTEDITEESTEETTEEATEATTEENETPFLPKETLLGDADMNASVTAEDARIILRFSVGIDSVTAENVPACDVNSDGRVSAEDARLALRTSVGLEEKIKHRYLITEIVPSDCKTKGSVAYSCEDCHAEGKTELPLAEHDIYTLMNIKATCTLDGYIHKFCTVCRKVSITRPEKLGHNWEKTEAKTASTCTRCSAQKTGWEKFEGKSYYFYEENKKSVLAVNRIVEDKYYVDITGVKVNDKVIDLAIKYVNEHSSPKDTNEKRLKDCYEYLYKNYKYKTMFGTPAVSDMEGCAEHMFTYHNGNCYRYSATFAYIARVLGFDSRVVIGKVRGVYGDMVPHSFTEVFVDGKWLICDASQNTAYGSFNWYLCTAENYPKRFERRTVATLNAKDGKVYWS